MRPRLSPCALLYGVIPLFSLLADASLPLQSVPEKRLKRCPYLQCRRGTNGERSVEFDDKDEAGVSRQELRAVWASFSPL